MLNFGFSYVGFIYLLMLFIPNIIWAKNKPKDYDKYVQNENKILQALERVGEGLVCCIVLVFSDFNIRLQSAWTIWLLVSFILMLLYEVYWVRYFRSEKNMSDFYTSICKIPVAGATLPVCAFLILGVYGRNVFLILSAIVLGIGHIGIHLGHYREGERIMAVENTGTVDEARKSFEAVIDNPRYREIIRDDKHLKVLLSMVDKDVDGNILDIGTGTGYLAFPLAEMFPQNEVTGIDITPQMIEKNTKKAVEEKCHNIKFLSFDGIHYPFEEESFALITTRYAFHHFPDIEQRVEQIAHLLKNGGCILVSDPVCAKNDAEHIIDKFMAVKGDGHIQFYTPDEIAKLFSKHGVFVEKEEITDMKFPFPQKPEYLDLFHTLSDKEKTLYSMREENGVIWVGNIHVANMLLRKKQDGYTDME